jgi:ABC-type amino acid transport substrate-binding protein
MWIVRFVALTLSVACWFGHDRVRAEEASSAPLLVGTSGDYAPFSVRGEDGSLTGFDIEVARVYAADRGRLVEFVLFRWPELQARLQAGDFDVAMSGITVRGDRLAVAPLTAAVARTDAVLLIRAGMASAAHDWTSLMVGVNRGGHLEQVARSKLPYARIVPVDDNLRLLGLLQLGEVDAVVTDTLEAARFPGRSDGEGTSSSFEVVEVLSHDRKAYWVSPRAASLTEDLDRWLAEREADGLLDRLRTRFFGAPSARSLEPGLARVTDLIGRRLMLMPAVSWAKQAAGRSLEDSAREAVVERAAGKAARDANLNGAAYMELVRAQFAAAKAVQRASILGATSHAGRSGEEAMHELTQVLRPAIDRIDRAILVQLGLLGPVRASIDDLLVALRADAPVPGLDDETLRPVAEALAHIAASRERKEPALQQK